MYSFYWLITWAWQWWKMRPPTHRDCPGIRIGYLCEEEVEDVE